MAVNTPADLARLLTNFYTSLYEKPAQKFNRPLKIATSSPEKIGLSDSAALSFNAPTGRYYTDLVQTGTYNAGTGFASGVGNYMTLPSQFIDNQVAQFWVAMRVRPQFANSGAGGDATFFAWHTAAVHTGIALYYDNTANLFKIQRAIANSPVGFSIGVVTFAANAPLTLVAYATPTQIGGAVNGNTLLNVGNTSAPAPTNTNLRIGGHPGSIASFNSSRSYFEWMAMGIGTIDAAANTMFASLPDSVDDWDDFTAADAFTTLNFTFLWPGVDVTNVPTARYGENDYA